MRRDSEEGEEVKKKQVLARWGREGGREGRERGSTLVLFAPEEMSEDPKAHT